MGPTSKKKDVATFTSKKKDVATFVTSDANKDDILGLKSCCLRSVDFEISPIFVASLENMNFERSYLRPQLIRLFLFL